MSSTFTIPPISQGTQHHHRWGQLYGCSYGMLLQQVVREIGVPAVVVVPETQDIDELQDQLSFFGEGSESPILTLPDWETLPYDAFSPHQDIVSQRLETLYQLPGLRKGLLITTISTLMQRLVPASYIQTHALMVNQGDELDITAFRERLDEAGYFHVPLVTEHGEFSVRGSLLDLYPTGSKYPYRIDLFDKDIESIRIFDPETQLTIETVDHIRLLPAREFPLDDKGISQFRQSFRREFSGNPKDYTLYNDISDGLASAGAEYYLPLFFEEMATLFDYLPENAVLFSINDALSGADSFYAQVTERYEVHKLDPDRPILSPEKIFIPADEVAKQYEAFDQVHLQRYSFEQENQQTVNFTTAIIPDVRINARVEDPASLLKQFIQSFHGRVLLTTESAGQREMLLELLGGFGIRPKVVDSWHEFLKTSEALCLTVSEITEGVWLKDQSIAIITDQQVLGQRARQISRSRRRKDIESAFSDIGELHMGSPVVHEDHGIGRYLGLQTLEVNGYKEEFLALEYADKDKLYVPVASLFLINRYTGGPDETAPLHRLGGDQWQKVKRKAAEKVRDVAAELLEIYAKRAAKPGYAFPLDQIEYDAFASSFPFEETEDQHNTILSVIADLKAEHPMDRVVCGDVGFGKTEVAMRAAFVAAQAGKQVAILAPTTLLAQQHFQNFRDRFADWPIRIEVLSRFRSKKETQQVLLQLEDGQVDIVIGTHKLIQDDVKFKSLGLLVVDEEHRFGVRQKEQLKKRRTQVDMLTLTATPIPRTLNMSLSGLRDLSIIATPPMQRLSVKTFVNEWRDILIQEACLREIKRGGQVYFLHNDVSSIERTADEIRKLVPVARVEVAHGQMRERELEEVMLNFYHRKFNVLVCTTIIESGIDVPTANTILMNRADKLGLAQLHQLRGRVGRSHHQAYAYLITPPRKSMTADAIKRIEAVESLEDLGAGFSLATHDLEIRGSGELLGEDQSGQISEIGFTLYNDLLNRAVESLKSGAEATTDYSLEHAPEIELRLPALIPDDYVPDVHMRLVLYKRIASASNPEAIRDLQIELVDRFGILPEAAKHLFRITLLKLSAASIGIRKLAVTDQGGKITFDDNPDIDPGVILDMIQQSPDIYRLDGQNTLRFIMNMPAAEDRFSQTETLLTQLSFKNAA